MLIVKYGTVLKRYGTFTVQYVKNNLERLFRSGAYSIYGSRQPAVSLLRWGPLHPGRNQGKDTILTYYLSDEVIRYPPCPCALMYNPFISVVQIPAEIGLGIIHAISCKSDYIIRGDSEGNINIWNIKLRQSKNIHTGSALWIKHPVPSVFPLIKIGPIREWQLFRTENHIP